MERTTDVHPKLDAVLSRLERVRPNAGSFVARCPAHEDNEPSLSVTLGRKGVVFHCHAGCRPAEVIERLNLTWADLFYDGTEPEVKTRRRDWRAIELEAMACVIRLQNETDVLSRVRFARGWAAKALELLCVGWDGARFTLPVYSKDLKLHDVLRYHPFTDRRKVLAGQGKSRLPWPAPEHVPNTPVLFLVEGEGTAISMLSVGLRAVALPGSIGKPATSVTAPARWQGTGWHKSWAQRFVRFRQIVCLPDCDSQGRALMTAAAYDLRKLGVDVSTIDLEPRSQDGRDVADILLKGAYNGESRKAARDVLRTIVAEQAEVLVA